jgi:uncharacterized protein YdeI (YjbR/CyaY-like superfamily)
MPPISHRPRFFATPSEFRRWLRKNHHRAEELWVGFHKRASGRKSLTWPESVDQALCYGWIDGVRKSLDEGRYTIRFTPRRPGSIWSAVNIRRARALLAEGRLTEAGKRAFAKRGKTNRYSFEQRRAEFPSRYERAIRKNRSAWKYFQSLAPSTKRICTWWVISAKKEETQLRRLAILIASSSQGVVIPPLRFAKKQG